ncbi:hypothetical protein BJ875DRAFT_468819 [Amylocarpus encephaloides]|uniref:Zn(2)-C6 fungal-type domain-containing protein n=1 Tax=Amylocarpus encephaloides TaxID=45428 RepID=A0A9P7YE50_9HELO|nr:hypothetical protein BJ875DRAFT_468819 [Amylocarpus encephaloides]
MSSKRLACDRCHRLKMLCKADIRNQQCNRCRGAKAHCNYSEPGKPGRPPANVSSVATPRVSADVEPTRGVNTSSERTIVDDTWNQDGHSKNGIPSGSQYFMGAEMPSSPQYSFANGSSDTTCLQLDQPEAIGTMAWPVGISHVSPSTLFSDNPSINEGILGEFGTGTDPQPLFSNSEMNTTSGADQGYVQQLAHFQVTISRMIDCESYFGPSSLSKLEQEAAHVLENSSIFLELIQIPASLAKSHEVSDIQNSSWQKDPLQEFHEGCKGSQESSSDTAVVLQLISISMRLTELHHCLFSTIYRYLQQDPDLMQLGTAGGGDKSPARALAISIAGVELVLHPHFQLRMLLYTCVHYLTRIQRSLSELEALVSDGISQRPPNFGRQTRMLIRADQQTRMAKIRVALGRLKDDFGINISI